MTGSISGVSGGMSASALKQMQERMFKAADRNGDGSISKTEMSQMQKPDGNQSSFSIDEIFSQIDSDNDGAVTRLESDAALAKMSQQPQGAPPQGPPPGPPPADSAGSSGDSGNSSEAAAIFDVMDTNKDGKVSLEELTAALEKAKSGSVTGSESSTDPVTDTLQALLDALDKSSSSASAASSDTNATLKNILTIALQSYTQQTTGVYAQSSAESSLLSSSV